MAQKTEPRIIHKGFFTLEGHPVTVQGRHGPETREHLILRTSDSIAGLLYDEERRRVLLVSQCRKAMVRADNPTGRITELVAGRFDANLSPKQLLVAEAEQEAGVTITEDDVVLLNKGAPMAVSSGVVTERSYLAFAVIRGANVSGADDATYGLAEEGEQIRRVWMPVKEFLETYTHECLRTYVLAKHLQVYLMSGFMDDDSGTRLNLE